MLFDWVLSCVVCGYVGADGVLWCFACGVYGLGFGCLDLMLLCYSICVFAFSVSDLGLAVFLGFGI